MNLYGAAEPQPKIFTAETPRTQRKTENKDLCGLCGPAAQESLSKKQHICFVLQTLPADTIRHLSFVARHSSLVIRHSSFVIPNHGISHSQRPPGHSAAFRRGYPAHPGYFGRAEAGGGSLGQESSHP